MVYYRFISSTDCRLHLHFYLLFVCFVFITSVLYVCCLTQDIAMFLCRYSGIHQSRSGNGEHSWGGQWTLPGNEQQRRTLWLCKYTRLHQFSVHLVQVVFCLVGWLIFLLSGSRHLKLHNLSIHFHVKHNMTASCG